MRDENEDKLWDIEYKIKILSAKLKDSEADIDTLYTVRVELKKAKQEAKASMKKH